MRQVVLTVLCILTEVLCGLSSAFAQGGGKFRVSIPYIEENGKFIVQATINGQTGRFLLDTGAPCCISAPFASKAGIDDEGAAAQGIDSNGELVTNTLVVLPWLRFGDGLTFTQLQAMKWPAGSILENFRVDGVIGYNLFRMGMIKFDHPNHTLIFTNYDDGLGIDSSCAVPLIPDPQLTMFQVKLGKDACDTVMFDSGAKSFYELSTKSFNRLKNNKKAMKVMGKGEGVLSIGAAGLEEKSVKYRVCMPKFGIGNNSFSRVTSITTDAEDSRIGSDLLLYGTVIIDYKSNVFYYIPYDKNKKKSPDLYVKDWDVIITVMNDRLCAGLVWDYAKLPLKGGEQIVEVNGVRLDKVDTYKAITEGYIQMPGDKAEIVYIDSAGKEQKVTIRKR